MRWNSPKPTEPIIGDTRHLQSFLWWPLKINNETRWLETAAWQVKFQEEDRFFDWPDGHHVVATWVATMWIN